MLQIIEVKKKEGITTRQTIHLLGLADYKKNGEEAVLNELLEHNRH